MWFARNGSGYDVNGSGFDTYVEFTTILNGYMNANGGAYWEKASKDMPPMTSPLNQIYNHCSMLQMPSKGVFDFRNMTFVRFSTADSGVTGAKASVADGESINNNRFLAS